MCVGDAQEMVEVPAHSVIERSLEAVLGRFVDASYAYRFGEPQQDLIVASLEQDEVVVSQAFRFPIRAPSERWSADDLGLTVSATKRGDALIDVTLETRRCAYGVRVSRPGFAPDDDAFSIEPGHSKRVMLRPAPALTSASGADQAVTVQALNLSPSLEVSLS